MQELINYLLTKMKIHSLSLEISFIKMRYLTLVDFLMRQYI
ncbi:hypothetical protein LEP1GSC064_3002 [Leptospira kirschneri serovar Grippotyphosa str. Moskva]|nr:hypothetical protein LEP1GSC044_0966 [Leptospira kirschneri serovar Grippotyphosa str. RM52]EKQ84692.1 hypothetical protein LEP1GSC064_3002 [Leptospira kirschneri serovar Grippotyphosa str. Moskva]EMK06779.1 hypothetical protein LEP1GSC176_2033 [Leptospira kirschneri str. MMD1493]